MLDPAQLRSATIGRLVAAGFPAVPSHLPVLWERDEGYSLRPSDEIMLRLAALNVTVAVSFGMPLDQASSWIAESGLEAALSVEERRILQGDASVDIVRRQAEVEAIWALVWVLSLGDSLDPEQYCPDDLVRRVPDLAAQESLSAWRARSVPSVRSDDEVMSELDLHYCMTWCLRDAGLKRLPTPGRIHPTAIWQRRRALEFVLDGALDHSDWEHIDLST